MAQSLAKRHFLGGLCDFGLLCALLRSSRGDLGCVLVEQLHGRFTLGPLFAVRARLDLVFNLDVLKFDGALRVSLQGVANCAACAGCIDGRTTDGAAEGVQARNVGHFYLLSDPFTFESSHLLETVKRALALP